MSDPSHRAECYSGLTDESRRIAEFCFSAKTQDHDLRMVGHCGLLAHVEEQGRLVSGH